MKEKPLIFSTLEVRAILDGKKTQTRRVVKPQPQSDFQAGLINGQLRNGGILHKRFFSVGDILYVKEAWSGFYKETGGYIYKADEDRVSYEFSWESPVSMPREAARIFLEVKSARVERLRAVTIDDAKAEGHLGTATRLGTGCVKVENFDNKCPKGCNCYSARDNFAWHWDWRHAKEEDLWENNPWVWVYEFARAAQRERETAKMRAGGENE